MLLKSRTINNKGTHKKPPPIKKAKTWKFTFSVSFFSNLRQLSIHGCLNDEDKNSASGLLQIYNNKEKGKDHDKRPRGASNKAHPFTLRGCIN
mmetsp:Transcript_15031/g.18223  ORF Transcript_15031/g.18223 Transcript_15031/m.18223 type:complete len:93 (-) Transcript_15031:334-612(-)